MNLLIVAGPHWKWLSGGAWDLFRPWLVLPVGGKKLAAFAPLACFEENIPLVQGKLIGKIESSLRLSFGYCKVSLRLCLKASLRLPCG